MKNKDQLDTTNDANFPRRRADIPEKDARGAASLLKSALSVSWKNPSPRVSHPEFQAPATESLSDVVERRKHQLSKATKHLQELEKTRSDLENQKMELAKLKREVTDELKAVDQDMDAIRSIVPSEGNRQAVDPLEAFQMVDQATELLVLDIMDQLPKETLQLSIREGVSRRKDTQSLTINTFLDFASHHHPDAPFSSVVEVILYYTLCSSMIRNIFEPFVPGGSQEEATAMHELHRSVLRMEAPDRSSRWESITYSYLKRDFNVCETITHRLLGKITSLLGSFRSWEVPDNIITALFEPKARELVLQAVKFQDSIRVSHTTFIHEQLMQRGRSYRADRMKAVGGRGESSVVVIPIGIGLFEVKAEKVGQGKVEIYEECLYPARVVCNDWAPLNPQE